MPSKSSEDQSNLPLDPHCRAHLFLKSLLQCAYFSKSPPDIYIFFIFFFYIKKPHALNTIVTLNPLLTELCQHNSVPLEGNLPSFRQAR